MPCGCGVMHDPHVMELLYRSGSDRRGKITDWNGKETRDKSEE